MTMQRRDFLKITTLTSACYGVGCSCANGEVAQAISPEELYAKYVPADKQLSADWLASLTKRAHPLDSAIAYSKQDVDLEIIGMTVGGIACGTVYVSGDGRLWVWDIFNQHHEGVVANQNAKAPAGLRTIQNRQPRERDGANFLAPPRASDHKNGVRQHFELDDGSKTRRLDGSSWQNVQFTGRWPIGQVAFSDPASPIQVTLEAYSPFIPLNLADSSLPLTVMEYTLTNTGSNDREVKLVGHLHNPLGQFSQREACRRTVPVESNQLQGIHHFLSEPDAPKQTRRDRVLFDDEYSGGWGNVGADHFVLTDNPPKTPLAEQLDYGSMTMAHVGSENATVSTGTNRVSVATSLVAGQSKTLRFAISWHLPNLNSAIGLVGKKRHYATKFADSLAVINYFAQQQDRLTNLTRTWVRTWNDSTLPQWFLDLTILTTNTLQTQNAIIFEDGRFWAWEGIGCCPGTCGHVWEYSQGHARLFPEIERNLREVTDYGIAQRRDGSITFRGSNNGISAIDAQCGYILRTLRDHQLSDDPGFLHRVWPATRKAIHYLIAFDKQDSRGGLDGLLDGEQHNTLDAEWFGKVHVLCSMYLAALRAGEELALQAGDNDFAKRCRKVFELGSNNIAKLFNGEYYEQIDDPAHAAAIGVGKGCYIDQAMGQFWANQLGLGRLCNAQHQKSALRALWKYNFVPEYGAFRTAFPEGRHYATANDSGLLMCTWPKGGLRDDFKLHWQYAYFNECMTGFEYEAAAHMVAEGDDDLVENGLAIARAIHDRYSALRGRNPYNEIECSDHYARAGASYAVFLAAGGFQFDQAKGRLAFAPVIQQDNFRTPFTTSQAWGTYQQNRQQATLKVTHGVLMLNRLDLALAGESELQLCLNGQAVELPNLELRQGDILSVSVSAS